MEYKSFKEIHEWVLQHYHDESNLPLFIHYLLNNMQDCVKDYDKNNVKTQLESIIEVCVNNHEIHHIIDLHTVYYNTLYLEYKDKEQSIFTLFTILFNKYYETICNVIDYNILFSAVIDSFNEIISNDLSKYPLRDVEFITKTRILDLSDEERKIINLK